MRLGMRQVWIVAMASFREGARKKFFLALGALCLLMLFFGLIFGRLSLDEAERLMINFGLAGAQLSLAAMALFFGGHIFAGDLERKALLTVLARPIRPSAFFLGRCLGAALLLLAQLGALGALFAALSVFLGGGLNLGMAAAFAGFFFESLALLAFALFFASYASPALSLIAGAALFAAGHFLGSISYFIKEGGEGAGASLALFALRGLPDLERVNWKPAAVYGDPVPFGEFASSCLYILLWAAFAASLGLAIMERRDYL